MLKKIIFSVILTSLSFSVFAENTTLHNSFKSPNKQNQNYPKIHLEKNQIVNPQVVPKDDMQALVLSLSPTLSGVYSSTVVPKDDMQALVLSLSPTLSGVYPSTVVPMK